MPKRYFYTSNLQLRNKCYKQQTFLTHLSLNLPKSHNSVLKSSISFTDKASKSGKASLRNFIFLHPRN